MATNDLRLPRSSLWTSDTSSLILLQGNIQKKTTKRPLSQHIETPLAGTKQGARQRQKCQVVVSAAGAFLPVTCSSFGVPDNVPTFSCVPKERKKHPVKVLSCWREADRAPRGRWEDRRSHASAPGGSCRKADGDTAAADRRIVETRGPLLVGRCDSQGTDAMPPGVAWRGAARWGWWWCQPDISEQATIGSGFQAGNRGPLAVTDGAWWGSSSHVAGKRWRCA